MDSNRSIKVLVTGASGFIGIHCVQQLLKEGYTVRGTVRDLNNSLKIEPLKQLEGAAERLELVEADLTCDDAWPQAVTDCTYVLHVASPFPLVTDESIIAVAVDGTLRVLRAAAKSTVKKVVLTSSCAAINEGHRDMTKTFDENVWTDTSSKSVHNYSKSKTLAEKAAWDFIQKEDVNFKLTTINPTLVVGPLLHNVQGTSINIIRRFLNNEMPAVPAVQLGLVDVRDVALAHIRAMLETRSDGLRILVTYQPSFWFLDIANVLRKEFSSQGLPTHTRSEIPIVHVCLLRAENTNEVAVGPDTAIIHGYSLPRFVVPYPIVWLYSFFDAEAAQVLTRIGSEVHFDNSRAKDILGIQFTDPKESIIAMAYDIIERGMVPKRKHYKGPSARISST